MVLNITMGRQTTTVENPDFHLDGVHAPLRWSLKTAECFGLVVSTLEKHFPDFSEEEIGEMIAAHILKGLSGDTGEPQLKLFGIPETGVTLYNLAQFINGHDNITPTMQDIERWRIQCGMTASYLPVKIDNDAGMRFEGLRNVTELVAAIMYYHAFRREKLVRCKHCGRWFATRNLKQQYCHRTSPCCTTILHSKALLECEQAVRNIMQNCRRIRNRIETKANTAMIAKLCGNNFAEEFFSECQPLYETAKKRPNVENLTAYYEFLKQTEKRKRWLEIGGNDHGKT